MKVKKHNAACRAHEAIVQRNEIRNTRCIITLIIKQEIGVVTKTNISGVRTDSLYSYCMYVIL
jgi:hypothetical protein